MAWCDTREEAERAKRAFENVLAPRFTRDEAIEIALAIDSGYTDPGRHRAHVEGVRATLEALAAAGVFSDAPGPDGGETMVDKLDRAGIR